jgi:hypothetical protein
MQWYRLYVAWEIAGRWVGAGGGHLLVVRADVGPGSLEMLSGDLYEGEGGPDDDPDDGRSAWRYVCSFHSELVQRRWLHARALELRAALSFQSRSELYGELVLRVYCPRLGAPRRPPRPSSCTRRTGVLVRPHACACPSSVARARCAGRA